MAGLVSVMSPNASSTNRIDADSGVVREAAESMSNVGKMLSGVCDDISSSKQTILESVQCKGIDSLEKGLMQMVTNASNLVTSANNISTALENTADVIDKVEAAAQVSLSGG
jgi:hypothetical protein